MSKDQDLDLCRKLDQEDNTKMLKVDQRVNFCQAEEVKTDFLQDLLKELCVLVMNFIFFLHPLDLLT